ncbi:MAG TPA: type II toxin-antitoxin system PemK/MazF family toxin [Gemmataceae bacterium]|jgi:mRNA interferase MazF|nr:type II toxin-antitoxin system PemK/MazF family toxin [Gemmataceae bacterium]
MPRADRGSVWIADLGLAAKVLPCLVLSAPTDRQHRLLVTVLPHTTSVQGTRSQVDAEAPFLKAGVFDAQQMLTVPQAKLVRKLGDLPPDQPALASGGGSPWTNWTALACSRPAW